MKGHKKKRSGQLYLEGSVADVIALLQEESEGMLDPRIIEEYVGYDGGVDYYVEGWVPMTEAEKEKAKKEAKQKREALKAQKEALNQAERDTIERLAEKHGLVIKTKE